MDCDLSADCTACDYLICTACSGGLVVQDGACEMGCSNGNAVNGICPGMPTQAGLTFTITLMNLPGNWDADYLTSTVIPQLEAEIAAAINWPVQYIIVTITGDPVATVVVLPEPSGSSVDADTVQQIFANGVPSSITNGVAGQYIDSTQMVQVTSISTSYCNGGYINQASCPGSSSSSSFAGWKIAVIVIAGVIFIGILYATYYFCIAGARKNPGVVLEPYEDTSLHPVDGPAPVSYSSGETTGPTGAPQSQPVATLQSAQPQAAIQMSSVAVATATPVSTTQVGVTVV